jgi:hypothetical protein
MIVLVLVLVLVLQDPIEISFKLLVCYPEQQS